MILTANNFVNVRLGTPSVNAENPAFLSPGKTVNVKARVIGDTVNHNSRWIVTEENQFLSEEGFVKSRELAGIPISVANTSNSPLFNTLKLPELWKVSMGENVKVGIIDTGVHNHSSLRNIVKQMNEHPTLDPANHGTTMACVIGSLDETNGKIGVAPKVSNIYSYFLDIKKECPKITAKDLIVALEEMKNNGVNIINMSFACSTPTFMLTQLDGKGLQRKINELVGNGCLLVAACGNESIRTRDVFPASYENVISVTGHNEGGDALNESSSFWPGASVALPVSKYFTDFQSRNSQGTSSASAILAGFLACIYHQVGSEKHRIIASALNSLKTVRGDDPIINISKFNPENFLHILNMPI
jgi:hypothetical protein